MKIQIRMPAMTMGGLVHVALALSLFTSVAAYGQSYDPCATVAAANEQQRALERQIANEPNPLRREDMKARLNQARSASIDASNRAKTANQGRFAGLTGRVTAFDPVSYNGSRGFVLVVTLSCGYTVSVRFREITNPAWGGMDPNDDTPLAPWRGALETIVVGDTVTVSGRFGNHFALISKLQKRGGTMYEVPDPGDLQERARAQEQQRNEAIAQRLANQLAGSWSGDWAMGGVLNPMATTSGKFVLQLAQDGSTLTGTYIEKGGQSSITGSIRGRQLNIEYTYSDGSRRALSGNLDATGTVSGTWTQGPVTGTWKMAKSSAQSNTTQGGAVGQGECNVVVFPAAAEMDEVTITKPYSGGCKDGVAEGQGFYIFTYRVRSGTWLSATKQIWNVRGEFRNGKLSGPGMIGMTGPNRVIEGEFRDNAMWNAVLRGRGPDGIGFAFEYLDGRRVAVCRSNRESEENCTDRDRILGFAK